MQHEEDSTTNYPTLSPQEVQALIDDNLQRFVLTDPTLAQLFEREKKMFCVMAVDLCWSFKSKRVYWGTRGSSKFICHVGGWGDVDPKFHSSKFALIRTEDALQKENAAALKRYQA